MTVTGAVAETNLVLLPGDASNLDLVHAGFKYGDHTTWSFSCDDDVGYAYATEDTGNVSFPTGALFLPYGVANASSVKVFGPTALSFPTGAYLPLPTGSTTVAAYADFTLEFWVNVVAWTPTFAILWGGGTGSDPSVYLEDGYSGFVTRVGYSPAISLGTWYHYAVCRKANVIRHFLDGAKFAEGLSTGALTISQLGGSNGTCYFDSIGFSNNYAHYDSAGFVKPILPFFSVPSSRGTRMQVDIVFIAGEALGSTITPAEADTQWSRTVLLLQGGQAVGSKVVVDAKGRTIYNQADVVYSDAQCVFSATNLYFNGSSAKLVIYPCRNLDLISGDFAIEFWVHPTRIQLSSLMSKWDGARLRSYTLRMLDNGKIQFIFYDVASASNTAVTSANAVPANTATFVSVGRHGDEYRVWTGGVGGTAVTTTKTPHRFSARQYGGVTQWDSAIVLGASGEDNTEPDEYFQGYIEDFRITNGVARYTTETYVPPTVGFLPTGSGSDGDPFWADVKLLCHFDEPDGTTNNIRDAKGHVLASMAGGFVSSSGMYGGGWFIGNSTRGYLTTPYGSEFDMSTGDFTIEVWGALSGNSGGYIAGNSYGQGTSGWNIYLNYAATSPENESYRGVVQWTQWDAYGVQDIALSPLYPFFQDPTYPHIRWYHVCVQRRGDDITVFVDGVGSTTTIGRRPAYLESVIYFGAYPSNTSYAFVRYDELRWTRAARYLGNSMDVPNSRYPETAFSHGAAVLTNYYVLIPGQVSAASVVDGATLTAEYSVVPPLIIGRPSVESPTFEHTYSVLAADATGGEGIPEDITFTEVINTRQAHRHAQVFYVNDTAIAQATKGVAVRVGVTDATSAVLNSFKVTEVLSLADSLSGVARAARAMTEDFTISGAMSAVWGVFISSAVGVADDAQRLMHQTVLDVIGFATTAPASRHALSLTEALVTSGTAAPAWHRAAADELGVGETAAAKADYRASVTDATTFDDAPALYLTLYAAVSEDVALDDVPAQTLLFQAIIQDHVQFKAFFASPAYTTWAMNTRNAAVTQYTGYNFNSFAKMGERYLGANDQGLFWLDGDDDAGRDVKARITTGVIQPNGNKLAGVQYAYLGMRGDGQFIVTVTDEAGGSYNYTLTSSSMETARVAFGRGFKTRYFTFSLESQGQDFDLDGVEFTTTEMARKIQR